MSAAARARMARAARVLLGDEVERGPARRAALIRAISGAATPSRTFADLLAVPDWLPADAEGRRSLTFRLGIASMAPALARTVDGALLRRAAETAGPELVDWGMAIGRRDDAPGVEKAFAPDEIEGRGRGVLRVILPKALWPQAADEVMIDVDHAHWAADRAREAA